MRRQPSITKWGQGPEDGETTGGSSTHQRDGSDPVPYYVGVVQESLVLHWQKAEMMRSDLPQ